MKGVCMLVGYNFNNIYKTYTWNIDRYKENLSKLLSSYIQCKKENGAILPKIIYTVPYYKDMGYMTIGATWYKAIKVYYSITMDPYTYSKDNIYVTNKVIEIKLGTLSRIRKDYDLD